MSNDNDPPNPPEPIGETAYRESVQIIAESLQDFANLVCTPDEYRHNAKAILARLSHADITVEKVLHDTDEDNVDGITKYRAAQRRFEQWEKTHPLADVAPTAQQLTDREAWEAELRRNDQESLNQIVASIGSDSSNLTPDQVAMLKAAKAAASVHRVPGWPVVIYTPTGDEDNGYLCAIRKSQPITQPAAAETITQPPSHLDQIERAAGDRADDPEHE